MELSSLDESNYLDIDTDKTIITYLDLTQEQKEDIINDYTLFSTDDDITLEKE
jgi:hypothetical protein